MEFTTKEIIIAILSSGGLIGGLVGILSYLSSRLDKRKERLEHETQDGIKQATALKKIEMEYTGRSESLLTDNLWKIIEDKKLEIKELKQEINELENAERLSRPAVMKIYEYVRQIKNEMDSLNIMLLSDEETNVFARRWGNIKGIMIKLEEVLSGQRRAAAERAAKGDKDDV